MNHENFLDRVAVGLTTLIIKINWLIVLLAILGAGYIGQNVSKLAFDNNYRSFFSADNPELQNFENLQATYTKTDNFIFVLVPTDNSTIFTNNILGAVGKMTEQAWQIPYATRVDSLTNFQYTYADKDDLIVEDLVPAPGASSQESLARQKEAALNEPLINGQLVTNSGSATAINVVLQYPQKSLNEVTEAVEQARLLRDLIKKENPHLDIYLSGTSMLSNAFSEAIERDFRSLIPIMILVILVVTAIAVRSISAVFITQILVILSAAVAMGWAGSIGIKLTGPSPSAIIVILTLAIADAVHILISARGAMRVGMNKRQAIIEAMRINFLAVSITSVTTIVGFMALNFSDSPPFRDFGNISAVGILAAWLFSLTLLPALMSIFPMRVKQRQLDEKESGFMLSLANFVIGNFRKLFVLFGVVSIALIGFIPQNEYSDLFNKYFDERIEFRTDTDAIIPYFGFSSMDYSINSTGPGGVSDPDYLRTLDKFSTWLREQPEVRHVYSIPDIMKRLNKNLNADNPAYYRLPDDRELAAQYLLLFELSLPYGLDLNDRINIDKSASRLTATLDGNVTTKETRAFIKASSKWFDENAPEMKSAPTGPQVMFTFIAKRNVESMIKGTSIAIVLVGVIMMVALRSFSIGLLSILPNALPILSALGAWAFLVGEVGLAVAAVASLSLGIVIDDTVHFLTKFMRARREKGLNPADSIRYAFQTVGVAIIVNTVVLMSGFMILTLSAFKINAELGLLTSLSIGFALILDFLFLPALLLLVERGRGNKFSTKKEDANVISTFSTAGPR